MQGNTKGTHYFDMGFQVEKPGSPVWKRRVPSCSSGGRRTLTRNPLVISAHQQFFGSVAAVFRYRFRQQPLGSRMMMEQSVSK